MPYDEFLTDRIRLLLREKKIPFEEKKMMGGLCIMVDDKMCCGIMGKELMARIGLKQYDAALQKDGCRKMEFTGREMKGYVFVAPEAMDSDEQLAYWLDLCLRFNPQAKSSKSAKSIKPSFKTERG